MTIMARLRGPRSTPGERVTTILDEPCSPATWSPVTVRRAGYADAVDESLVVVEGLGLEVAGPMDAGDLVRFVYAQGWQAAEKRMAAPDKADDIDQALRDPAAVLEQRPGESMHGWQVRAVQAAVAYGVPNKGTV